MRRRSLPRPSTSSASSLIQMQSGLGGLINSAMGVFPSSGGNFLDPYGEGLESPPSLLRLKEPRDLYSTTSLQHPPKWPIECQVIGEKVKHIDEVPSRFEGFYEPTGSEPQPKPVGEDMGTVVFNYHPKLSVDYFCRSCVGGADVTSENTESDSNTLQFESRFESGNLAKAIKVTNVYYELHLRQDLYTDRHSQWFYFRVQNTRDNLLYRFSIVNFNKNDSLYRCGLKLLMYSEKEAQLSKTGWLRCGQNITYFRNDMSAGDGGGTLYTLSFNLRFKHSNDTVYLAHCYPYTYSQLQHYLSNMEDDRSKSDLMTVRLLCRSLAGNNVYVVTITSPENYNEDSSKKPAVVISARVHPGETQSSYMMKGIIDFLTSQSPQAKELRDRFIFKLIPMLNPDGVIVGNSRCCLLGQDLNRQYRTVLREAFPQIYQTKVMLRRLAESNGVFLYCDIHGHSRKHNVFIYGCENRKFPEKKLAEQVFPLMLHKNATDKFSFQSCKFRVQKTKEGTGRVFAWTLGIVNSYTLEISLGGSTMASRQFTHFNTADYEALGRHFCETLIDYSDPSQEKEQLREKILGKLNEVGSSADEPLNVPLTDYSSISHSDSEESEGETSCKVVGGRAVVPPPLKRQLSLRKPPAKKAKPPKFELRRQSINTIQTSVTTTTTTTVVPSVGGMSGESTTNLTVFKRLTKFRRKVRKKVKVEESSSPPMGSRPKCSVVVFDDPFNPPGGVRRREGATGDSEVSDSEDECNEPDIHSANPSAPQLQIAQQLSLLSISKQSTARLKKSKKMSSSVSGCSNRRKSFTGSSGVK